MGKIKIALTNDYEIFADGSGDIKSCLIDPTNRILEITNKYNIPITIMADVCEYWAFKNEELKGTLPSGYRPASWIAEQLINCVKNNHDVQLHLHPQWTNYSFNLDTNNWKLDFSHRKVSSLSYEEIRELLNKGKEELEGLLRPFKPDYECTVFRAGSLSVQPEEHIFKALVDSGFKIDTSIAPGRCFKGGLTDFDFRGIPHKLHWFIKENIKEETETGILELPIYTRQYFLHNKIYYKLLGRAKKVPRNYKKFNNSKIREPLFKRLLPKYEMFDFCAMSANMMIDLLKGAERKFINCDLIPIVAIGHSKAFNDESDFESFINKALDRGYNFTTFQDLFNKINSRKVSRFVS